MKKHNVDSSHKRHPLPWVLSMLWILAASLSAGPVGGKTEVTEPVEKDSDATEATSDGPIVELDPYSVVGSRIRGIDLETTIPIETWDADALAATGFSRLDDTLRNLPMMFGPSNDGIAGGGNAIQGARTVNIHGFGTDACLVLVDGLRMVSHDGSGGFFTPYNLDSLPDCAVEKVEILKDGASAIYGSDAVSGVIDIRTIRDLRGTRLGFSVGHAEGTRLNEFSGSFAQGRALNETTNLVVAIDTYWRSHLATREYAYMASTDYRDRGGANWSSPWTYPASFLVTDPDHPWLYEFATYPEPTSNPTLDGLEIAPFRYTYSDGGYNYNAVMDYLGDNRRTGAYVHFDHHFDRSTEGFVDLFFQHSWTRNRLAPTPYTPQDDISVPAANPYNPFGSARTDGGTPMDLVYLRGRILEAGPRIGETTTTVPRIVAGLKGRALRDWRWDFAGVWSESRVRYQGFNNLRWDRFAELLEGVDLDGDGFVSRDEYFNPFGPNTDAVVNYMRVPALKSGGRFEFAMADVHAYGPVTEWGDWKMKGALGAEYRTERLSNWNDPLAILGASLAADTAGSRKVAAGYAELEFSRSDSVTVQLAGRAEHYSDFGQVSTPKMSASWRLLSEVLIRGSYGEGFTAPSLPRLYQPRNENFYTLNIIDPKLNEPLSYGFYLVEGGNPGLRPATSSNRSIGVILEPFARLRRSGDSTSPWTGLTFGVDRSSIDWVDVVDSLSSYFDWFLDHEDELETLYPGQNIRIEREPPQDGQAYGKITRAYALNANIATYRYRGYDLWAEWPISLGELGNLLLRWDGNSIDSKVWADTEVAGTWYQPRMRWSALVGWSRGAWATEWYFQHVDGVPPLEDDPAIPTASASFRVNAQVSYAFPEGTRITIGARNLFDVDPPFDGWSDLGFYWQHPSEKRFWYARVDREF